MLGRLLCAARTAAVSANALLSRGFKMATSLKLRCEKCYFTRREGRLYVGCKVHPRHKQRQGRATRKQKLF